MADGFTFNLPQVPVAQGFAPQALAPLQFNLPLNAFAGPPLQFQPNQAVNMPNAHPELVGQGIVGGAESILKGVTAAIQAKREEKKEQARADIEQKRFDLQQKQADVRMQEMDAQIKLINARADGSLPNQGSKAYTGWATPRATPRAATGVPASPATQLPHDFYLYNRDAKPLSVKDAPVAEATSAADSQITELAPVHSGRAQYTTRLQGATTPTPAATATSVAPMPNLGKYTPIAQTMNNVLNAPMANAKAPSTDDMPEIREFPPTPEGYQAALAEAKQKYPGYLPNPQVTEGKHGGYKVNWMSENDPKIQSAKASKSYHEFIQGIRAEGLIKSEVQNTINSQVYKNYVGPNGLQGVLPRAFIDTEQAKAHPEEAAVADQALIDLYVRAQTGTVPRETQIHMLQSGMSLRQKAELLGVKFQGNSALLAEGMRQMMERVVAKDAKSLATRVNKDAIEPLRNTTRNTVKELLGREVGDDELAQPMVVPELRDEFVAESDKLKAQYLQAAAQYSALRKDPNKRESAIEMGKQIDAIKKRLFYVDKRLTDSKGYILNMPEIEQTSQGAVGRYAIGVGQGGGSAAAGGVSPMMLNGMMIAPPPVYNEPPAQDSAPDGTSN